MGDGNIEAVEHGRVSKYLPRPAHRHDESLTWSCPMFDIASITIAIFY